MDYQLVLFFLFVSVFCAVHGQTAEGFDLQNPYENPYEAELGKAKKKKAPPAKHHHYHHHYHRQADEDGNNLSDIDEQNLRYATPKDTLRSYQEPNLGSTYSLPAPQYAAPQYAAPATVPCGSHLLIGCAPAVQTSICAPAPPPLQSYPSPNLY